MDSLMTNWNNENLVEELEQIYFSPNSEVCMVVNRHNKTIITNAYEGIPETLILNLVAWIFLFMLFTLLRQQAWDYGRLALVNSYGDKKRWTQIFYGDNNNENITKTVNEDRQSVGSTTGVGSSSVHAAATTSTGQIILNNNNSQQSINHIDNGYLSWIWMTIKLKPEQIMKQCGPDAVHYLSFQKHLIFVMSVITFVSLVVILPINFQGTLSGDVNSFGHTTISNLNPKSNLLWIHVFISICYVPLVVLVMRRSSGRNSIKTASTCTIMITNINKNDCNKQTIDTYIKELFPDVIINDIQLAYNIAKLVNVANEYEKVIEARSYCEKYKNYKVIKIKQHQILCCLNKKRNGAGTEGSSINDESAESLDALEYYKRKEIKLYGEVIRLKASALNEPLGIAFVTVQTTLIAKNIIKYYRPSTYREWTLTYAPAPSDLFWENLSVNSTHWYIKWFFVNLVLFLFLFFLTTPVLIVNIVDALTISKNTTEVISKINPLVSEFLPTLLLWTLSALMPVIVSYSDKWLSHWTRSKQNYSIMTKTFGYLLFMILILPSLGLTSAQAFIEWTIHYNDNTTYRWECIFLPDKGAFFVNYIITAAFIGTSLELIRFPELIMYLWSLLSTKSQAEIVYVRRNILIEFPFGIHYAWTVMVFTMSTVYSIACPLIMPFAMVYILLKHFVDRHNLYFAYSPSNMISQGGGKIHSSAVTMTKISVILLLIITAALASVRGGKLADPRAIVLIIAIVITLGLFAFMSPIKKCTTRPPTINEPYGPPPIYIADVLLNEYQLNEMTHLQRCEYGSDSNSEMVNITASESEQDLSSMRPIIDA